MARRALKRDAGHRARVCVGTQAPERLDWYKHSLRVGGQLRYETDDRSSGSSDRL